MHRLLVRAFLLATILALAPVARAAEPVDLLLVLAADVSRSVDNEKFKLQREGYAAAIADNTRARGDQRRAQPPHRGAVLEWSGFGNQKVVIDWTPIDGPKAAQEFGDRLLESPRSFADRTSISGGIDFAVRAVCALALHGRAPHHRRLRRRHQQCRPRRDAGARRGAGARHHHQRAGDPQRSAAGLESGAHQPARRADELLSRQRHRRARRVRAWRPKISIPSARPSSRR